MPEIQLIILRDGKEIFRAKLDAELRDRNPILRYDEESYEELHFSDDVSISSLETLLWVFCRIFGRLMPDVPICNNHQRRI